MPPRFKIAGVVADAIGVIALAAGGLLIFRLLGEIESSPPGEAPSGWENRLFVYVATVCGGALLVAVGHIVELLVRMIELGQRGEREGIAVSKFPARPGTSEPHETSEHEP